MAQAQHRDRDPVQLPVVLERVHHRHDAADGPQRRPKTLPVGLMNLMTRAERGGAVRADVRRALVLVMLPTLILYICVQKKADAGHDAGRPEGLSERPRPERTKRAWIFSAENKALRSMLALAVFAAVPGDARCQRQQSHGCARRAFAHAGRSGRSSWACCFCHNKPFAG